MKFELIQGTVYLASPLRRAHARWHVQLSTILERYECKTPGVELLDNAPTILGEESEPQPDLALRILAAFLGQSRETKDDYVEGPPELMMEISHSTRALICVKKRPPTRGRGSVSTWSWASLSKNCTGSISEPENLSCRPGRTSTGLRFFPVSGSMVVLFCRRPETAESRHAPRDPESCALCFCQKAPGCQTILNLVPLSHRIHN